jgi:hypothetical protein
MISKAEIETLAAQIAVQFLARADAMANVERLVAHLTAESDITAVLDRGAEIACAARSVG